MRTMVVITWHIRFVCLVVCLKIFGSRFQAASVSGELVLAGDVAKFYARATFVEFLFSFQEGHCDLHCMFWLGAVPCGYGTVALVP